MTDSWPGVGRACWWFGRIFSAVSVYLIKVLSLRIVRLQLVVTNWPGGRNTTVVAQLAKIFFAQPKQCRAVKLGIASNVVVSVRVQVLAIFVDPGIFRVVCFVHIYNLWIHVLFL